MKCPYCSSDNTRVIDSRPADDNYSIRRRRLCDDCAKRFTTYEVRLVGVRNNSYGIF